MFYDAVSKFTGNAQYAIHGWLSDWAAQPIVMPIEPWWSPGTMTHVKPGAKQFEHCNVPIHTPGLDVFNGSFTFGENSNIILSARRGIYQKGTKANVFQLAEWDAGSFNMSPQTMGVEIGNNPGLSLAYILNGCYSGIAQDADGNVIGENGTPYPWLSCLDQIYGGKLAVLTGGTKKDVNPAHPELFTGDKWYNAHENFDLKPTDVTEVLKNMQNRRAMNGIGLGIGREGLELLTPYLKEEEARQLFEVFREIAGAGVLSFDLKDYQIDTGGSPQTNQQVVFGSQTNPVFGRAKVRSVPGMRSDLMVLKSPPPMANPAFATFLYVHGGQVGDYEIQDDPAALQNDKVPHIAVYVWDKNSSFFTGANQGSKAGDIGISMLVNEGFAAVSGLCCEFLFEGSAS